MNLTDGENGYYFQQTKTISLHILSSILCFLIGLLTVVSIGLLFRFLRLIFGSKVEPSAKKAIVITGATSGIGLALAKRFYRKKFTVFATYYNTDRPGYGELREIISNQGTYDGADQSAPKLFLVYMDVRSEKSIDAAANEIERLIKKFQLELHSVICNAGVANDCFFEINRLEHMQRTIQTNLLGTVMVAKRFILPIIKSKGRIVIVSSIAAYTMVPAFPIYIATKSALKSFADCLNECLNRYGASCRCVCPGNMGSMSNQIFTAANSLQDSEARLNSEERELYKAAMEENSHFVNRQLVLRVNQMREDPKRAADMYAVDLPENKNFKPTRKTIIMNKLISFIEGGDSDSQEERTDFDKIGVLTAFDYAVCLKDPPRRCYCGNRFFQYITGPLIFEYMPQILVPVLHYLAEDRVRGKI